MTSPTTTNPNTTTAPATDTSEMAWKTWPDWVNLVLAVYLALAPIWTVGATAGWFVTLGVIGAVVALWALATASSPASEWVQVVVGVVVFLAPWLGGFAAATAAAWTAWIIGVALVVFALIAMAQRRTTETHMN